MDVKGSAPPHLFHLFVTQRPRCSNDSIRSDFFFQKKFFFFLIQARKRGFPPSLPPRSHSPRVQRAGPPTHYFGTCQKKTGCHGLPLPVCTSCPSPPLWEAAQNGAGFKTRPTKRTRSNWNPKAGAAAAATSQQLHAKRPVAAVLQRHPSWNEHLHDFRPRKSSRLDATIRKHEQHRSVRKGVHRLEFLQDANTVRFQRSNRR